MTADTARRFAPLVTDVGQELPQSATLRSYGDRVYAMTAAVEARYG
jgi:hypothetical protein